MRIIKISIFLFGILVVLGWVTSDLSVKAQMPNNIDRVAIQVHNNQLYLLNVDDMGQVTPLIALSEFELPQARTTNATWEIPSPSQIVVSPDGNHIAFTALQYSIPEVTSLFIYTLGQPELHQVAIPGLASLSWSPDSSSILLLSVGIYAEVSLQVHEIYLYDLATDGLAQLTDTPNLVERSIRWFPDSQRIIYTGDVTSCNLPCISINNLYVLDSSDLSTEMLTDLGTQLLLDMPDFWLDRCYTQNPIWSDINARFYFTVSCNYSGGDLFYDVIYSVDLTGNSRLEINLLPDFSEDYYVNVESIYPSSNSDDVYVVASGKPSGSQYGFGSNTWRLYRITTAGQSELVAQDVATFNYITATALSPDEEGFAISGVESGEYLFLVDLSSGQALPQAPTQDNVFDLDWLDSEHLLYMEFSFGDDGSQPLATWELDITTGNRTETTIGLEGLVWVRSRSSTKATNQSPEADAGQDQPSASTTVMFDGSGSTDSDGTVVAYQWHESGTLIAEGVNPQVTLAEGEHTIILTVVDDDGGIDRDTFIVTVEGASCDFTIAASDTPTLISTITTANGSGNPTTICLADDSTYTLTTENNILNGLPIITGDITIEGNNATITRDVNAPDFHFFEVVTGAKLTLNDLTLSNGDVSGDSERGGALMNDGGETTLNNVTFDGNAAGTGGAIDNEDGLVTINDSTFVNNVAAYGGAIDNDPTATTIIIGSTFTTNHADFNGGAIHNDGGTLTVSSTAFTTNMADDYGGGIDNDEGDVTLNASTFTSNSSDGGGAIRNDGTLTINAGSAFNTNAANNLGWGGAIYNKSGTTLIINASSFDGNTSNDTGGAIRNQGDLTVNAGSSFDGNSAVEYGGAIYNTGGTVDLTGVQITNNIATSKDAGGVYVNSSGSLTITDSTLSGNDSGRRGGGIWSGGGVTLTDVHITNNTAVVEGGGVYGSSGATISAGNSCISGNSSRAVYSASSSNQNFENNWWGATDGPSGSGSGSGDGVNSTIDYDPFVATSCPLP